LELFARVPAVNKNAAAAAHVAIAATAQYARSATACGNLASKRSTGACPFAPASVGLRVQGSGFRV